MKFVEKVTLGRSETNHWWRLIELKLITPQIVTWDKTNELEIFNYDN